MRIKRTYLTALTVLALTVGLGVTTASATELVSESNPTYLYGSVETNHILGFGGGGISCVPGGMAGETHIHPSQQFESSSVADYKCSGETLKMNGCQFIFHPGNDISGGAETTYDGTFDIGPAGCGPITTELPGEEPVTFYPATGLAAEFHNKGAGSERYVSIDLNGTGLKYTWRGNTKENGTYYGTWIVKGYANEAATVQTGIHVASNIGFFMSGQESKYPSLQPKFFAESYPLAPTGEQGTQNVLTVNSRTTKCGTAGFRSEAAAATSQLSLDAEYGNCITNGLASTVDMNSCHYTLSAINAGPPYTGKLGVACDSEGDAIEIDASGVCSISIAAQEGRESVALKTVGEGHDRGVQADFNVSGLQATVTGSVLLCGTNGLRQNGAYTGSTTLYGLH